MESGIPTGVVLSRHPRPPVKVVPCFKDVSIMGIKLLFFLRTSTWQWCACTHTQCLRGFTICKYIQKSRRLPPHKYNPRLFVLQRRPMKQIHSLCSDCVHTQTLHLAWECAHTSFNAARLKRHTGDTSEKNTVFVFLKMTSTVLVRRSDGEEKHEAAESSRCWQSVGDEWRREPPPRR